MKTMTVRITKSWHVKVPLEYGDSDSDIRKKALDIHEPSDDQADSVTVSPMPGVSLEAVTGRD